MTNRVWLINLFGTPCAPSAFHPDNSLAALAGSLKRGGFSPLIIDFQNVSFCSSLVPEHLGRRSWDLMSRVSKQALTAADHEEIADLNDELGRHQRAIIDREADVLIRKAESEKPLLIGLKLYSGEGSLHSRQLARRLRERLKIPIVGGGPLIRVVGAKYLEFYDEFDFLLDGEADRSLVAFARALRDGVDVTGVAGLVYRHPRTGAAMKNPIDAITNMSEVADPCYDPDVYPVLYEKDEKIHVFQLDESRGCPNQCHFCVHPIINGQRFRTTMVDRVIHQIKELQERFGAVAFRFTGSNTPKKFLRTFAEEILREGLEIRYSCFASVNTTTEDSIELFRRSGLAGVFIGAETLDQGVLDDVFNKRGQPPEKTRSLVKAFLDAGIYTTTSWIYPMPNYTHRMRNEVRDFILEAYGGRDQEAGSVILLPAALVPNTEWFLNFKKYGFDVPDLDAYYRGYIELVMKFYVPRQVISKWTFTMQGKTFDELAAETDDLAREIAVADICLGVSDDWMLAGQLSGRPMKQFRDEMVRAFILGDYAEVRRTVATVNENS
ncbi:MAG: radical SAM protein, partial [Bdellovibrionaceae bacterium]|nr:radical SAM protein [Pseudobdellovibrionaceae bacterium]